MFVNKHHCILTFVYISIEINVAVTSFSNINFINIFINLYFLYFLHQLFQSIMSSIPFEQQIIDINFNIDQNDLNLHQNTIYDFDIETSSFQIQYRRLFRFLDENIKIIQL